MTFPIAPDDWFNEEIKRGRGVFDRKSYERALVYCKERYIALDIGAHVGSWTAQMAKDFLEVHAFEPDKTNFEYLRHNTSDYTNAYIYNMAAGEKEGRVSMKKGERNSGQSHIVSGNETDMIKIDDVLDVRVDLIKFDVEGYEYYAMRGAERVLRESDAVVIWENNGLSESRYGLSVDAIDTFLHRCGYSRAEKVKYDEIWVKHG